ncbi:hypothetical protein ACSBR2_037714 [Camellia fascicularis]
MSLTSSPQVSSGQSSMELPPLANKPVLEKKAAAYAEVVKNLNNARERSFPFKVRPLFLICNFKVLPTIILKHILFCLFRLSLVLQMKLVREPQKSIQEIAKALTGSLISLKPATVFKGAYESLGLDASSGKAVSMQKIWHLIQTLMGEGSTVPRDVLKKMSLVIGARRHLEWGHDKYIIDTIQSHHARVKEVIISFFILMEQGKATVGF